MAQINLKNLRKSFGQTEVIPGLDLQVRDGEFMVFVGPSGCGKSTLLRMIAGLESVSAGEIHIAGVDVTEAAPSVRGAAMVFQSYALYPHMTVEENMGFGLRMSGAAKQQTQQQVHAIAEKLHLTPLLQRYPKQLSGGQRQRVAIGRAIVRRPQVFLFDEPLSNLDAALRVQMRIELAKLHAELKTTMIYVTHDQTEAMTLGDRIAVFNQGRIEQVGRPMDLYAAPDNTFVAQFLGTPKINLIPYTFDEPAGSLQMGTGAWLPTAASAALLDKLKKGSTLGVRPESFVLAPNGLPGVVEFVENLGDASVVYIRLPGLNDLVTLKAASREAPFERGDAVGLAPDAQQLLVFDTKGQLLA